MKRIYLCRRNGRSQNPNVKFLILILLSLLPTAASAQSGGSPQAVKDLKAWLALDRDQRPTLSGSAFARPPLSKEDAQQVQSALWKDHEAMIRSTRWTARSSWTTPRRIARPRMTSNPTVSIP